MVAQRPILRDKAAEKRVTKILEGLALFGKPASRERMMEKLSSKQVLSSPNAHALDVATLF
jgi:hypothetical protein